MTNNVPDEMLKEIREQTKSLNELVKWARVSGSAEVKKALSSALDNDKKRIAYHLSDGKNTSSVIAKAAGLPQTTVSTLWKEWLVLGLGDAVSASGGSRFVKSFDLKTFGIPVPAYQLAESKSNNKIQDSNTPTPTTGGEEVANS